jgi:dUTP pyrophosphatase
MSGPVEVLIRRLPGNDLPLPSRSTAMASGFDLRACIAGPLVLAPGERAEVPTGVALALPEGWEAQVRPRSGLARDKGLTMINSPGTIDADYRGEVVVLALNLGSETVEIRRGDRIAQMIIAPVPTVALREVESLPGTARGEGGFGHTGSR